MNRLDALEEKSVFILREAYAKFQNLAMLWSIGKDSTALLWLARKAFFGHVPFPLVHIDTGFEIPELLQFRDRIALEWKLYMVYGQNEKALNAKQTYPDGAKSVMDCCRALRTEALKHTLSAEWTRYKLNHATEQYEPDPNRNPYEGVIVGIRADEEGSRSKERYFSPRDANNDWDIGDQPPEFWNQFKTDFAPGAHVRIHPLLDWTELNIWQYIQRENIPMTNLYFNRGTGLRYRSLGCHTCTFPVESPSRNVAEIIAELETGQLSHIAERSGRAQDNADGGSLEVLRREGYM